MNFAQGLSAAGHAAGDLYGKQSLLEAQSKADLLRDEVAGQRAQRLAEFKANLDANMADKARTESTARIDAKAGQLADAQLAPKYGDVSARSPDQQDRLTATRAEERSGLIDAPALRTRAAIATGDIGPKDAAVLTQKDDSALYKILWEKEKEDRRDSRFTEGQDRQDARQQAQQAAAFALLDKRLAAAEAAREKKDGSEKANTLHSTQVDGNGYLVGVYRNGTTKKLTDPETGKPVTSQSFEQRVDRVANALVKEGDSEYRKMDPETLRQTVRQTLISADGATAPAKPPAAPASAARAPASALPKPGGAAQATRPPLDSFFK